jgi:cyclic beta-1,2-glucan synthetase
MHNLAGQPAVERTGSQPDPGTAVFLQKLARKTWSFFEQFVVAEENWLPPDNFQEQPVEQIAHRTSPTNIGLSLLANVTAHDFGYLTSRQMVERTSHTMATMEKMERYKGHFYNWYDTQSLTHYFRNISPP